VAKQNGIARSRTEEASAVSCWPFIICWSWLWENAADAGSEDQPSVVQGDR